MRLLFSIAVFSTMLGLGLAFMIIFALAFGGTASFGYENAIKFMIAIGTILFIIFYILYVKIYKTLIKHKKFTAVLILTTLEISRIVVIMFSSFVHPDKDTPNLSYYLGGISIFFLVIALLRLKLAKDMYSLSKREENKNK